MRFANASIRHIKDSPMSRRSMELQPSCRSMVKSGTHGTSVGFQYKKQSYRKPSLKELSKIERRIRPEPKEESSRSKQKMSNIHSQSMTRSVQDAAQFRNSPSLGPKNIQRQASYLRTPVAKTPIRNAPKSKQTPSTEYYVSASKEGYACNKGLVRLVIGEESRIAGLFDKQTEIEGQVRAVLINWIMKISSQLRLRRSVVSLGIVLLDSYTTLSSIDKTKYQLFGVAALLLAYKQEERSVSEQIRFTSSLVDCCDGGYTKGQLLEAEKTVSQRLQFRLSPATHHFWIEYFTLRWDYYLEEDSRLRASLAKVQARKTCHFRNDTLQSYYLYSQLNQLTNAALLSPASVASFSCPKLVVGALYLVLRAEFSGKQKSGGHKFQRLRRKLEESGRGSFLSQEKKFNALFRSFLQSLCSMELAELGPVVVHLLRFSDLRFLYELPNRESADSKMQSEDFERTLDDMYQRNMYNQHQLPLALQLL